MVYYLLLTERCNLSCHHCIRGEKGETVLPSQQVSVILDSLASSFPHSSLVLTGGEPTLHPNFNDILLCADNFFREHIAITSNGCTPYWRKKENLDMIVKYNVKVQISLDGEQTTHDQIRGRGTFQYTLNTIQQLKLQGAKVSIATVATLENINKIPLMIPIISRINPSHWTINPCLPYGNTSFEMPVKRWNRFVDDIKRFNELNIPIHIQKMYDEDVLSSLTTDEINTIKKTMLEKNLLNCGVGKNKLYIYPDMSVYGCTCLTKFPFGNLREHTLTDILKSETAIHVLQCQLKRNSFCRLCKYVSICNGGCPGMSVLHFGEIGYGDHRCPFWRPPQQ